MLFGDLASVQLLNAIGGGGFMWDVQQILWRDLLLHITRLTDRAKIAGRDNVTVRALPQFCESPELQTQLQTTVDRAVQAAEFARDWRNRRISHSDLQLAIDPDADSLATATLRKVQTAFDAVYTVLATISTSLLKKDIANDVVITPRAQAFLAHTRQLAVAVQYVDSIVDPTGTTHFTDRRVAEGFLRKLDIPSTWQEVKHVVELREAARRFQ